MKISFEINSDEERVYREAAAISWESFDQMARDGGYHRACDIISNSKRAPSKDKAYKTFRFCAACTKVNKPAFAEQCVLCKKSPSKVYYVPSRKTAVTNARYSLKSSMRKAGIS
jgi:hypothetical protein